MPPELPGDIDPESLGRYLAGECAEAETAVVRRYLMARPHAARVLGDFLASLDADAEHPPAPDARASWTTLRRRLRDEVRGEEPGGTLEPPSRADVGHAPPARRAPRAPRAALAVARSARGSGWRSAGLVAVAAAVVAAVSDVGAHRTAPAAVAVDAGAAARTYVTQPRERAELQLVDGTRVHLAPGSRLRVAADYGTERRDVSLEGEAFFDVMHDALRPFTVFAGNASAHDLGTAFAVRSYAADGAVQVTVRSGAVAFSGVGRLTSGDVGRLTGDGRASVRHSVDVDALLGWLDGTLVFQDAPLGQVLQDLGRWYEVDARLSDPALARLPFTGTLDVPDAERAVRLVAATLGLRVKHDGTRFTLAPTPGRTPPGHTPHRAAILPPVVPGRL